MEEFTEKELKKINKDTLKQVKEIINKTFMDDKKYLKKYVGKRVKDLAGLRPQEEDMEWYTGFFDIRIRKYDLENYPEKKKYSDNKFYMLVDGVKDYIIDYNLFVDLLSESGIVMNEYQAKDADTGKVWFPNSFNLKIDRYASKGKDKQIEEENKQM